MDVPSLKDEVKSRNFWSGSRARIIAAVSLILLLTAGVLVIARDQIGQAKDNHRSRYFLTDCDTCTCDDIAIIGGGISGTYAAWKLRGRGLSISVYEYSDRIGGRIHTMQFPGIPDINVELGAMRFVPVAHPLMVSTAAALNLSVVDFPPGFGFGEDSLFYLRGVYFRRRDLGKEDNTPYNMKPNEKHLDPGQLKSEYFVNYTTYAVGDPMNDTTFLYSKTPDGTPLYEQSVDVAYSAMGASKEATAYLRDTDGFYGFHDDAVASQLVVERTDQSDAVRAIPVKTIGEGMQALPEGFAREFLDASTSHTLLKNHELWKIERQPDKTYQLSFWPTETTGDQTLRKMSQPIVTKCAKKIILSIPRQALDSVDWEGFRDPDVSKIIQHSIKDVPAAKIFLAYDRPWWKDLPFTFSHSVSDLPNRQTYDFGTSNTTNKSVFLAAYVDMEDVKFWRELQSRGSSTVAPSGKTNVLNQAAMFHATRFVAELFNISVATVPKPIGGAISMWDEFPFGGGWQVWLPGFDWTKVGKKMIKPSDSDDVFVATNGFSGSHGSAWAEFALEQADRVIDRMDNA